MRGLIVVFAGCLLLAGCWDEVLDRSDKPLSRAEASKKLSLLFPQSARDIYFVFHAGGLQEYELFVRFTVSPAEMDSTVDALIAERDSSPTEPAENVDKPFQPMVWWRPNSIVHGQKITGARESHQPIYIWTDTDNNIVFVLQTD